MNINVELSEQSLDEAIMALQIYRDSLDQKASKLVGDLATQVEEYAAYELSKHIWTGETLESLRKKYKFGDLTARVLVGGAAIWLEFGTGVVTNNSSVGGYVHPMGAELGICGLGTYGQGHGADPNFHGIPATLFMWNSAQAARRDIPDLARRIFRT